MSQTVRTSAQILELIEEKSQWLPEAFSAQSLKQGDFVVSVQDPTSEDPRIVLYTVKSVGEISVELTNRHSTIYISETGRRAGSHTYETIGYWRLPSEEVGLELTEAILDNARWKARYYQLESTLERLKTKELTPRMEAVTLLDIANLNKALEHVEKLLEKLSKC